MLTRELDSGRREVGEFFVARAERGRGVGRAAALALFAHWPGPWTVFHDDANAAASRFWPAVAAQASSGQFEQQAEVTSAGFAGQCYMFSSARPGGADAPEPVEVVEYDPAWPRRFDEEASRICLGLSPWLLAIEHIGSTAVPGLAAKPVLDIQVGLTSLAASPAIVTALQDLGYTYCPRFEATLPFRRFFRRTVGDRRSSHLHVVERTNTAWWDAHVAFRDWLRAHPSDRDTYAELKRGLALQHRGDRDAYTSATGAFVTGIGARDRAAG